MPTSIDNDTTDLKALVMNAVTSGKALLDYVQKNPGKLTELKREFKEKFGTAALTQLVKLVF